MTSVANNPIIAETLLRMGVTKLMMLPAVTPWRLDSTISVEIPRAAKPVIDSSTNRANSSW